MSNDEMIIIPTMIDKSLNDVSMIIDIIVDIIKANIDDCSNGIRIFLLVGLDLDYWIEVILVRKYCDLIPHFS